ncbi:hypothetical protein BDQ17DRAFT_1432926 [Cyathus striatus]|nr:hypothetical protein BDQ17DRAFT_1432926 [Cyathus striatus]
MASPPHCAPLVTPSLLSTSHHSSGRTSLSSTSCPPLQCAPLLADWHPHLDTSTLLVAPHSHRHGTPSSMHPLLIALCPLSPFCFPSRCTSSLAPHILMLPPSSSSLPLASFNPCHHPFAAVFALSSFCPFAVIVTPTSLSFPHHYHCAVVIVKERMGEEGEG